MKTQTHQTGKTFSGILIGLVMAVVVIAGLLWFLNNNKTTFQQHETVTEEVIETEELTPPSIDETHLEQGTSEELGSDTQWEEDTDKVTPPDSIDEIIEQTNEVKTPQPVVKQPAVVKEKTKTEVKAKEDKPVKVTPEQILDNGSIEKAREQVKKDTVEQAKSAKKITLQAGSYTNEDAANTQRARLIMMGIDAKIETAQVGGRTVYRVKTNAVAENQAAKVKSQLKNNGIDFIAIPSK